MFYLGLRRTGALAIALLAILALHAPNARAGAWLNFSHAFDLSAAGDDDFLSHVAVMYYVDQPVFPYISYRVWSHVTPVPIGNGHFSFDLFDNSLADHDYAHSFAITGIYTSVLQGSRESFFSTFSDPSIAVGHTFEDVFADLGATETEVIDALKGNDPTDDLMGILSRYVLLGQTTGDDIDNAAYVARLATSVHPGQTSTLVHFSDGIAFGTATSRATPDTPIIPEPATLVLLGGGTLGWAWLGRRRRT